MKPIVTILTACLIVLAVATARAADAPVKFTEPPKAAADGAKVRIEFAVDRAADVEVAIVDAAGRVVRHLAAGVLGKNPPTPLAANSLKQSIVWDRADDAGKPVAAAGHAVRVRAGLKPTFDKVLGYDSRTIGDIIGLAVGPGGELFVWDNFGNVHPSDASATCRVFGRAGNYLRTIIPYPAGLSDEQLKGLRRLTLADGRKIPFLFQAETRSFYPGIGNLPRQRPVVTRDGRVVTVGIQEICGDALRYAQAGPTLAVIVRSDGSVPEPVVGPLLAATSSPSLSSPSLALSPDEKTIYFTGVFVGYEKTGRVTPAVMRCGWADKETAPFIGDPKTPGDGPGQFKEPRCLATDAAGNLYVSDYANDRVSVFKPDGGFLGQINVPKPDRIEVHRKTGAVYVLAGAPPNQLIKFDGYQSAKEVARVKLPNEIDGKRPWLYPVLALDDQADKPILWAGAPTFYCRFKLLRIEDEGNAFGKPVDVAAGAAGLGRNMDVHATLASDEVFVLEAGGTEGLRVARFNGQTGERNDLVIKPPANTYKPESASLGRDGMLYVELTGNAAGVYRFDRDGKPAPFASGDRLAGLGSLRLRGRGLTATASGEVFVLWQKPKDKQSPGDAEDANALAHYAADGTLKTDKLIDSEIRSISSIRVDAAGNLYLAVGARPDKVVLPDELAGMDLGVVPKYGINSNLINWYPMLYGSIVKFSPAGGVVRKGSGGQPVNYAYDKATELKGASWMYPYASALASWRTGRPAPDVCLCESASFGLDGFGRSFFPDAARFQAGVLDANGNEICRFGDYGNADSAAPGGKLTTPAIPIHWLHGVGVSDQAVYLGDRLARRVVRVKLDCAAQASCPLP